MKRKKKENKNKHRRKTSGNMEKDGGQKLGKRKKAKKKRN